MSESLRDQIARALAQVDFGPAWEIVTPENQTFAAETRHYTTRADAVLPLVEAELERVARFGERTQDELLARLAEVRRERDDLELSMATVAAGFEQARARVADLERALRDIQMWAEDGRTPPMVYVAGRARGALDVAPFVCENCGKPMRDHGSMAECWPAAAPASDQLPVPERTTGAPGGES